MSKIAKSEKRIIPCLDIRDGKVVKGVKFTNIKEVGSPLERAVEYARQGADELVIYDIAAYDRGKRVSLELISEIYEQINVPLCVAGGVKTIDDFSALFGTGISKVSINSAAFDNPDLIKQAADTFGSESVVVGIDAKRNSEGQFVVAIKGGQVETGQKLQDWVQLVQKLGAGEICLNSIDADGVKSGYDIEMLKMVCESVRIPVIASGGCGKLEHFAEVFTQTRASAALAASVFHYNELTVKQVKDSLLNL
ncbi:MAG: imidazole glycerol phosphate synthase subunit HisF [Oscillospiraceae bacterium]|nr:imidazole glycerol phosphate synthase subunit HisF [Oscillospiraceae bacterium]